MKAVPSLRIKRWLLALCLLSPLALSGCMNTSSGRPIDADKVALIQKGKTTRAEVEALLGRPEMTIMLGDGKRSLSYVYSSTKMGVNPATAMLGPFAKASGTSRTQTLQVTVGRDGVVEDYELGDSTRDISGQGLNVQSTTH